MRASSCGGFTQISTVDTTVVGIGFGPDLLSLKGVLDNMFVLSWSTFYGCSHLVPKRSLFLTRLALRVFSFARLNASDQIGRWHGLAEPNLTLRRARCWRERFNLELEPLVACRWRHGRSGYDDLESRARRLRPLVREHS